MRKLLSVIFVFLFLYGDLFCSRASAIYDPLIVQNNRVGLHILDPGEIEGAAKIVNGGGGEWGYVTIPMRSDDRDLVKWQQFMRKAKELKIIPIIRLATYFQGSSWVKPEANDILDFANFLSELTWPTKNRYVVVFNEPNHADEWGGETNPGEYSGMLRLAVSIFKFKSEDFFVLPAGLDSAAPDSNTTLSSRRFILEMGEADPGVFLLIDGWTSHSYPNPAFSGYPADRGWSTIVGYRYELYALRPWLGDKKLPIFITETGWQHEDLPIGFASQFLQEAFSNIWKDSEIVAITPFVYSAYDGPFVKFSFLDKGEQTVESQMVKNLPKITGQPMLAEGGQAPLFGDGLEVTPPLGQSPIKSVQKLVAPLFNFFRL